jgi:enoyl-[acyl-carrier protein] reductase III
MTLAGKMALVTGSSRGIGRAISLELARRGADIIIHYLGNHEGAEKVAKEVRDLGRKAHIVRAHLKHVEEIDNLFEEVRQKVGHVDILVNNAASGKLGPVADLKVKGWEWTLDINTRAALLCSQRAAKLMESRGGGRIINLSSLGAERYIPDYVAVGVSKAALQALTRYLAVEFAPKGILVNTVSAGLIDTDAIKHFPGREMMMSNAKARIPMGRLGTAEDVAKVVAFLCSEDAGWICGQTLVADGGYSLVS